MFLIYINDFPNVTSILKTILFADDSTFCFSHSDYQNMITMINEELVNIHQWTLANRLTINVEKTKMMLFTNRFDKGESSRVKIGDNSLLILN